MTNDVVGAAADAVASVGVQACSVLGQEFSRGQEFVEQIWAWLMDKGVEFLAHVVAALLILFVGGFFVKLVTALVRKALRKSRRVNELLEAFLCSVVSKTGWIFLAVIALGKIGVDVGPLVAGLGVTGLRRNGSHANVRVGKQDADKGMPEHMRMNFADTRLFGYPVHNGTVGVQALTKAVCSTPR